MAELFADLPEALANSVEIARRCSLTLKFAPPYHLPNFPVPEGYTTDSWLRERAREGLLERFKLITLAAEEDVYWQRLDYELGIIEKRSEEHTSELQSLMRISYAVFCLKKKKTA